MARELALFALQEGEKDGGDRRRADGYRHRLARLERKLVRDELAEKENAQLFSS